MPQVLYGTPIIYEPEKHGAYAKYEDISETARIRLENQTFFIVLKNSAYILHYVSEKYGDKYEYISYEELINRVKTGATLRYFKDGKDCIKVVKDALIPYWEAKHPNATYEMIPTKVYHRKYTAKYAPEKSPEVFRFLQPNLPQDAINGRILRKGQIPKLPRWCASQSKRIFPPFEKHVKVIFDLQSWDDFRKEITLIYNTPVEYDPSIHPSDILCETVFREKWLDIKGTVERNQGVTVLCDSAWVSGTDLKNLKPETRPEYEKITLEVFVERIKKGAALRLSNGGIYVQMGTCNPFWEGRYPEAAREKLSFDQLKKRRRYIATQKKSQNSEKTLETQLNPLQEPYFFDRKLGTLEPWSEFKKAAKEEDAKIVARFLKS